jgi:hypothetical protein
MVGYGKLIVSGIGALRFRIGLVYFLGVLAVKLILSGGWQHPSLGIVTFLVGGMLGLMMDLVDRLIYAYYSKPDEELSLDVKNLVRAKRIDEAILMLWRRSNEQVRLAMNNVLFLGVWIALGLFVMTSSSSALARGLILGIGLEMLIGILREWNDMNLLRHKWFWPIKREVAESEIKITVAIFIGFFGLLTLAGMYS